MTAQELAERLGTWRKVGAHYLVHCPAHEDQHPSLTIANGDKGVVLKCQAGCDQRRVIERVCEQAGITPDALFYAPRRQQEPPRIVMVYPYPDARDRLLYEVVRLEPKGFRQRRPNGKGGWIWNIDGIQPVLYRLPEVIDAVQTGRAVYIVEGEKDVETLRTLGLTATTAPMGGGKGKWRPSYTETLRSATVVILPDNDAIGREHAQQVAQSLHGIAASVKVLVLPGLPEKGDVSDWVERGGTRDALETLVAHAPLWVPSTRTPHEVDNNPWQHAKPAPAFLAEADPEFHGFVRDLIAPGAITLLASPRGDGKTMVIHALAVALATGGVFRHERLEPCRVFLLDRDNPERIIKQRLKAWGGAMAHQLTLITRQHAPDLKDRRAWEVFPVESHDVLIVDSVGTTTEGITEKEGRQTTEVLATLRDLAKCGLAIILLHNTTKDGVNVRGRGEWSNHSDIVYEVRDATNFTPSKQPLEWWRQLPEAGEHTWAARAARRTGRIDYRLAFIPSKYRLGPEPEPFCLEVYLPPGEPWTLRDVTTEIVQAGQDAVVRAREKHDADVWRAVAALQHAITEAPHDNPLRKTDAEALLKQHGLTRQEAREVLERHNGTFWVFVPTTNRTGKGKAFGVFPLSAASKPDIATPHETKTPAVPLLADGSASGRRATTPGTISDDADSTTPALLADTGKNSEEEFIEWKR